MSRFIVYRKRHPKGERYVVGGAQSTQPCYGFTAMSEMVL